MIYIIIYIIGFIVAGFLYIQATLDEKDYTYSDIPATIFIAICSWIALIVTLVICIISNMNTDTVIFKKRK